MNTLIIDLKLSNHSMQIIILKKNNNKKKKSSQTNSLVERIIETTSSVLYL